ncbi:hypothetical protein PENTCL1PPCAC_12872 [Pristionchus entomophagus]|uniref:Uncharacterized protein n=1 Tax=Pristionchus entomophagus TaxID=358040 RepID=A0AAV5T6X6_9BILA|nr:hypothetical protein PENTCL1PPCAC_12872 [Pristionchus entomophagus]
MYTDFYMDQVKEITTFHKRMYDLFIETQVPMLNIQLDAMQSSFKPMFQAWYSTAQLSKDIHCAELEYLRSQCLPPLTEEECPITKFQHGVEWTSFLDAAHKKMIDYFEEIEHYREDERWKIQNRLYEHTKASEAWLRDIAENSEYPGASKAAYEAISKTELERYMQFSSERELEKCLQECKSDYQLLLEKNRSSLIESFDRASANCREVIDHCVGFGNSGSSDFIREMKKSEFSRIDHFETTARRYLETLGKKVQRSENKVRNIFVADVYDVFNNEMTQKLNGMIAE